MMDIKAELRACARPGNLYQRALIRIMQLEGDCHAYQRTMEAIATAPDSTKMGGGLPVSILGQGNWHPGDDA